MQVLRFSEFETHIENGKVGDLIETLNSGVSVNSYDYPIENDESTGILKTSSISNGFFFVGENKKVIEGDLQRVKNSLKKDTILVSRMNTPALVGEVGYIDKNYDNLFVPDRLWVLKANDKCVPKWLTYMLIAPRTKSAIKNRATGTSASMKNISKPSFLNIKIPIPYYKEQQKIADFLSSVDKKISLLKEKHALLTQYKKGVMQKLFKQKIRFKDDNGNDFPDWQDEKLGKWLEEYKAKSTEENQFEVLTSSRTGLMKQSDYYGEGRITERSNLGFNVIPSGYLTFRSRSDDRQFFFNLNELGYTGIISTYYPVFKMNNDQNKFFIELSRFHKNRFGRQAVGTSQVVLSFNELKNIKFAMPCTEEQAKIAEFARALDKKLAAVDQQIELTQTFKKGLLQQMFV